MSDLSTRLRQYQHGDDTVVTIAEEAANALDTLQFRLKATERALSIERVKFDNSIKHLVAITGMLAPNHIRLPDGRVMEFSPPAESVMGYWRALTDAIKAAREYVHKAEQPPVSNSEQS